MAEGPSWICFKAKACPFAFSETLLIQDSLTESHGASGRRGLDNEIQRELSLKKRSISVRNACESLLLSHFRTIFVCSDQTIVTDTCGMEGHRRKSEEVFFLFLNSHDDDIKIFNGTLSQTSRCPDFMSFLGPVPLILH